MQEQLVDAELALQMVRESKILVTDTETTGLRHGFDKICGWVFTDHSFSVYVPVRHEAGGNIPNVEEFETALAGAFRERGRLGRLTVGHNLGFDLRFSLWHGVVLESPLEDTMINESLIDDRTRGYSLEECCLRHRVTPKKGEALYAAIARRFGGIPDRKQMGGFWRMPGDDPLVVDYATGDGISTLDLWDSQQPILDEEELRVPWRLECDILPYVARVHHRGIKVDHEYAGQVDGLLNGQITEKKAVFAPGFNARSPKDVEALFRLNNVTEFALTETGKPSFTEKWLETNEIGEAILEVRRLEKARDSFIAPLVSTQNINGRVHPTLHQSKSDTYGVAGSRFSCSEPNLQAFTKRNKSVGKVVRALVIPDDDWLIEEGDAIQQEPRLFAHFGRDPELIAGYKDNSVDIHDLVNQMMFKGMDRDKAKRVAMGILTGLGIAALGGHVGWSFNKAKDAKNEFYRGFPGIKQFQIDAVTTYERRGYVRSILGRRARLESMRYSYQAVSRVIQNSGGDHIKTCFLRASQYEDAYPDHFHLLLTIHDSLLWQRQPGHSPRELIRILENVPHEEQFSLRVPIPFEVGSGRNWAEASYPVQHLKDKKGTWHD